MTDGETRTETCVIGSGDVVVERTVAHQERGVIVTVEAESTGSGPKAFTLIDEFPEGLPVSDAGFRPGTEPPGGGVDSDRATVEAVVGPEEGCTVVYALKFYEAVPEVDLGEPELVEVGPRAEEPSGDPSVLARGGSTATLPQTAVGTTSTTSPAEAEVTPTMSENEPEPEAETSSGDPESGSESAGNEPVSEPSESDPGSDSEPPADGGKKIGATLGLFSGDRGARRDGERAGGRRSRRTAGAASPDGGAVDGHRTSARSNSSRTRRTTSNWSSTGTVGSTDAGAGSGTETGAADGVAAALVEELREGTVSDDEIEALRRELGAEPTASDDVRIEHLQARVGEFEAYAEDLRAVIDEHGSVETFVDGFDGRLDGLREDLEAVEAELSATREAVEAFEDRLEAVEAFREEFSAVFAELGEKSG